VEAAEQPESRREVRPGLVMVKRPVRKEDGRRLIYYEFERPAPGTQAVGGPARDRLDAGRH
jgi:hypothetical protein